MRKNYVLDANILLHDPYSIFQFADNTVIVPIGVIGEIDAFKKERTNRGYNARAVVRLLDSLRGEHSLLSAVHWKDVANWILLVVPVPVWLVLSHGGTLRRRAREPELAFLLVQAACLGIALVLLDRKLGSARDWDLLAPHVAGLGWIAVRLWEPEDAARGRAGVWPGLRFAAPWVAYAR